MKLNLARDVENHKKGSLGTLGRRDRQRRQADSDGTRGSGRKLKEGRVCLDFRKKFLLRRQGGCSILVLLMATDGALARPSWWGATSPRQGLGTERDLF